MLEVLIGATAGAFVAGAFSIVRWLLDRGAAKADRQHAEEKKEDAETKDRLDRLERLVEALIKAERQSYYCSLKALGKEYIARGEITTEELEDFMASHGIYHDTLGGNGFLDALVKDVKHVKKV